jgi:hypothetical protein
MTDKAKQLIEIAQHLLTVAVAEMAKDTVVSVPAAVAPKPIVTTHDMYEECYKISLVVAEMAKDAVVSVPAAVSPKPIVTTHDMYEECYKINCVFWNETDLWVYRGDLGSFHASQIKLVQRAGC